MPPLPPQRPRLPLERKVPPRRMNRPSHRSIRRLTPSPSACASMRQASASSGRSRSTNGARRPRKTRRSAAQTCLPLLRAPSLPLTGLMKASASANCWNRPATATTLMCCVFSTALPMPSWRTGWCRDRREVPCRRLKSACTRAGVRVAEASDLRPCKLHCTATKFLEQPANRRGYYG